MNGTKATVILATILAATPSLASSPAPDRDPHAADQRETYRRDGVIHPAPPSCTDALCDRTRAFRFKGGTAF